MLLHFLLRPAIKQRKGKQVVSLVAGRQGIGLTVPLARRPLPGSR